MARDDDISADEFERGAAPPARPLRAPQAPARAKSAVVVAIDAMGGDRGPEAAVAGLLEIFTAPPSPLRRNVYQLFGDEERLSALVAPHEALAERVQIRHAASVTPMDATPREALRLAPSSSMAAALHAVATGQADAALSAGNTAALMTLATVKLRTVSGLGRPAIAALWPAQNAAGAAVVLDVGADLRADAEALSANALLGAEYARAALGVAEPRVALLNIGSEDTKGRPELREAADRLRDAPPIGARFVGFIEADAIAVDQADVIVTDGFSGNVALKAAEGAARLVGCYMRETFQRHWAGKLAGLLAAPALKALKSKMDPRRLNGGAFLGLGGVVVKSHGGADGVAFQAAIALASRLAREGVAARIAEQVAMVQLRAHDGASGA